MRRPGSPRGNRRGTVALEALILLPLFVVALVAFVELTSIVSAENRLCRAAHAGAKAACGGADRRQIEELVEFNLGPGRLHHHHKLTVCRLVHGPRGEEHLERVEDPCRLPPHTPVVVTVECPATEAVPSLLRCIGVKLSDDVLRGQTTMWKE